MRNGCVARIRHEPHHAAGTGANVDTIRLRKKGIARGNVERFGNSAAAENEKPSLWFRFQTPGGVCGQIDPFEYEVWAGNEKPPLGGKLIRPHLKISRPGVGHHDGVFDMKLTVPAGIEQAECRVAPLLEFRNDETRADGVNGSR